MRLAKLLSTAIALCAGCVSEDAGPSIVADSAGVSIVETPGSPWDPSRVYRQLAGAPTATIESSTALQLYRIESATRLTDGRIAVANGGTQEIGIYQPTGEFGRALGGEGQGPGEFASLSFVGAFPGDSIVAYDSELRRLSVFDSAGAFVRSFTPELEGTAATPGIGILTSTLQGHSLLFVAGRSLLAYPESGVYRPPMQLKVLDHQGRTVSNLGEFPGATGFVSPRGRGFLPLGAQTSTGGVGGAVFVATAEHSEVLVINGNGQLRTRVRWMLPPVPLTDEQVDELVEATLVTVDGGMRPTIRAMLESTPFPEFLPAYGRVHMDDRARLWVERFELPASFDPEAPRSAEAWAVFDEQGIWLGSVHLPEGDSLLESFLDSVLLLHRDQLGVESLRVVKLEGV